MPLGRPRGSVTGVDLTNASANARDAVGIDAGRVDLRTLLADSHVSEVLDELDRELIGLQPVKARVRDIAALLLVERARNHLGLAAGSPSLHMSFTGNP